MSAILTKAGKPTRQSFSERMLERGSSREDFAVFESDIGYSTFSYLFGEKFPRRYFNLGIAEMATMAAAAGLALDGRTAIVSGYGVFLTMRALEVVRSFICYPNLNVKILASHGGLTAAIDGTTHQATEDMAFMGTLPGMNVLCPCDERSAAEMFDLALGTPGPFYVRLMRDALMNVYGNSDTFTLGGSKTLESGSDVTIACYGDMVFQALEAAAALSKEGISAEVIDFYSIKPLDAAALTASVAKTGRLLVVENHQRRNGLAYAMSNLLLSGGISCGFAGLGLDDTFGESGSYIKVIEKYGLGAGSIADKARALVRGGGKWND